MIWLKQKMHLNYGIVQARVMNSSLDGIKILPTVRTADKSSREIELMFCTYFYTTYRNKICVMKFDINVYTNYICVDFKYKNSRFECFIKYPTLIIIY